ncbi:hypothetical protein CR513_51611, partial [Mucuna pruriens]
MYNSRKGRESDFHDRRCQLLSQNDVYIKNMIVKSSPQVEHKSDLVKHDLGSAPLASSHNQDEELTKYQRIPTTHRMNDGPNQIHIKVGVEGKPFLSTLKKGSSNSSN